MIFSHISIQLSLEKLAIFSQFVKDNLWSMTCLSLILLYINLKLSMTQIYLNLIQKVEYHSVNLKQKKLIDINDE